MKKILAMLLALMLLLSWTCIGEGIQLDSLTNDELLELLQSVQQEIADRKIEKTASLMGGKYIAGEDIPSGKYVLRCTYDGDLWASLTIYSNRGNGSQKVWEIITEDDGEFEMLIDLEQNDRLSLDIPFTLTIYVGVMFN